MENEYQRDRDLNQGREEDMNLRGGYQDEPRMGQQPEKKGMFERAKDFIRRPSESESHRRDQDMGSEGETSVYDRDLGAGQGDISQRGEDVTQRPLQGDVTSRDQGVAGGSTQRDVTGGGRQGSTSDQGAWGQDVTQRDQGVTGGNWQGGAQREDTMGRDQDVTGSGWQGGGTQRDVTDRSWQESTPTQGDVASRDQGVTGGGLGSQDVTQRDQDVTRGRGQEEMERWDQDVPRETEREGVTRRDQDIAIGAEEGDILERGEAEGREDVLERGEGVERNDVLERDEGMGPSLMREERSRPDLDREGSRASSQAQQFDNQPEENYAAGQSERSHGESFDLLRDRDEEQRGTSRSGGGGEVGDVTPDEQFSRPTGGMEGTPEGEAHGRTTSDTTEKRPPEQVKRSDDMVDRAKDKLHDLFGHHEESGPERQ